MPRPPKKEIANNLRTLRNSAAQRMYTALFGLLLSSLSLTAQALPDDREQPIHITADKAIRDEKRGVTVYSGHVQMRQGSMELDAESLTIFHEKRDADKIVARGTPAKMRQQPELDQGLVHAHADVITYFRDQELIHLRTSARLTRDDGTLVTGDSIDYYIAEELVKAESDRSDANNKVFVIIPPSAIDETEAETSETNTANPPAASALNSTPPDSTVNSTTDSTANPTVNSED